MNYSYVFIFLGKGVPQVVKNETLIKDKVTKIKVKSQPAVPMPTVVTEEPQPKANGSSRKAKDKPTCTIASTQPQPTTKPERQRSISLSPALSSSSNPTPPPVSSASSSPSSSQEGGGFPSSVQQQILQGASLAEEEEEIDRARDEAEDFGKPKKLSGNSCGLTDSSAHQDSPEMVQGINAATLPANFVHNHPVLESSNNHSFFSTGPLPAYTVRSNGTSPSGCNSIL